MSQSRLCKLCGLKLSAYNDDQVCFSCLVNPKEVGKALKEIRGLANNEDK